MFKCASTRIVCLRHHVWTSACYSGSVAATELADEVKAVAQERKIDREWAQTRLKGSPSPIWEPLSQGVQYANTPLSSMEDYITSRGFSGVETPSSFRALTSVLTFPLSLSHGIYSIYKNRMDALNITVIGARAESSLPSIWWREIMRTCPVRRYTMRMIGPGLPLPRKKQLTDQLEVGGVKKEFTLHYTADDACYLHNHVDLHNVLLHTELFVLYNPGLGSLPLKASWKPTLDLILSTKKPILCTAHGRHDMERDVEVIKSTVHEESDPEQGDQLEYFIHPTMNPFRSHQRALDIKEDPASQIYNCNYGIYAFQTK